MLIRGRLTMFKLPGAEAPRPLTLLQLIAILALAISTLVAAAAVSIGLARAAAPPCITAVPTAGAAIKLRA
jgi:hypothetical protein